MAPSRSSRRALAAALLAGSVAAACGARGPLDTVLVEYVAFDASIDGAVDGPLVEGGADTAPDGTGTDAPADGSADASDAAGDGMSADGGPILNCATCVEQTCGTLVLGCVTSTPCRTALQCAATTCLTGGVPSLTCLEGCTMGNTMIEGQLLELLVCVAETCSCASLLVDGGLGGL